MNDVSRTFDLERAVREGCQTRDGRKVRILCTDRVGDSCEFSVVALLLRGNLESVETYRKDGTYDDPEDTAWDLQNIPRKHVRWVNLYERRMDSLHFTREDADGYHSAYHGTMKRLGCNRIELEERWDE